MLHIINIIIIIKCRADEQGKKKNGVKTGCSHWKFQDLFSIQFSYENLILIFNKNLK